MSPTFVLCLRSEDENHPELAALKEKNNVCYILALTSLRR